MSTPKGSREGGEQRRILAKSGQKLQKILNAAAKVFRAKGYAGARLSDIAEEAGTLAGSLYYYFKSRDELVEKVLERSMTRTAEQVMDAVDLLPDDARPSDRIKTAIRAHLMSILVLDDYLVAYHRIIHQVPEAVRESFVRGPRAYARYWDRLIDDAQNAGELRADLDPRLMRLILLGAVTWTIDWYKPGGRLSKQDIVNHVIAIFFQGTQTEELANAGRAKPRRRASPKPS